METIKRIRRRLKEYGDDLKYMKMIKRMCSETPITECAIVKTWLCQGSRIWPQCNVTRRQRPMRALVSFTLQRNLRTNMRRTNFGAFRHSQLVQVDQLVSYPLVFIHLSFRHVRVELRCRRKKIKKGRSGELITNGM